MLEGKCGLELFCAAWSWTDYVTNESKGNSKHE